MTYIVYKPPAKGVRTPLPPYVRLSSSAYIVVSSDITSRISSAFVWVILGYETGSKEMKLKLLREPTDDPEVRCVKLSKHSKSKQRRLHASGWQDQFGVQLTESIRFQARYDEGQRMIIVDLKAPIEPRRGKQAQP